MKKVLTVCLLACALLVLAACSKEQEATPAPWLNNISKLYEHNQSKIVVTGGIAGTLTLKEGNCMPIVNRNSCKEYPVKRGIVLYPYLTLQDVEMKNYTFYTPISAKPLLTTETDAEGFYEIEMPAGVYSIFILEDGQLYANGLDGQGGINPVVVEAGSVNKVNLRLDYAVY
ncbi:hypothetical protein CLV24_106159 [Pontibacter ummariensis]|uniref:Carboxypeptidase regulatory-like domain-containing protein n=1 Tax=Pontibacter ummariensis TaxID=1610492 RepID=A0A239EG83_9BACT|nr:hypothetical protein [Pontibacter ummariensis]PRY13244.1 hypothetical protein CLV24_106159 [Pontibacter ummariensis]SNS43647.1 hypothetical protein SAMN06296052_106159 [Pontibacter ummariensis]